jgi:predicted MFS family arabinose efflux permease
MSDDPATAPVPSAFRRTFAALSRRPFRLFYLGLLCNMAGFWLRIAATGLYVFELTGSRERLGVITAAGLLPWIPISPLAGVLAERTDPRRLLIFLYLSIALVNAALGIGILEGRVGWTLLLVATIFTGCLRGMEMPARHAIVRRLVDRPMLSSAIGLNAAGFHLMNAIGFSLAGLLYEAGGAGACYLAVGTTSFLMALQMMRVELGPGHPPAVKRHPLRDLAEGFAYVRDHQVTRTLVFGAAGVVALLLSYRVLMPAIADEVLDLSPRGYGALMAVSGAGSFLAALWIASGAGGHGRRIHTLFAMVWVACAAVLGIAWTGSVALAGVALFVAGFCQVGFMAGANTTVQETVPDSLRARVMGIWALLFGLAYPVGGWLQGFAAERWGENITLSIGVAAALVLSALVYSRSARRLSVALRDEMRKTDEQPW